MLNAVYDLLIDDGVIDAKAILHINKYLMKKHITIYNFIKSIFITSLSFGKPLMVQNIKYKFLLINHVQFDQYLLV